MYLHWGLITEFFVLLGMCDQRSWKDTHKKAKKLKVVALLDKVQAFCNDRKDPSGSGLCCGLFSLICAHYIPYNLCIHETELLVVTWKWQRGLYLHCFPIVFLFASNVLCFLICLVILRSLLQILLSQNFSYFLSPRDRVHHSVLLLSFVCTLNTADTEIISLWRHSSPVDWKLLEGRAVSPGISFTWNRWILQYALTEQNHLDKGVYKTKSLSFCLFLHFKN